MKADKFDVIIVGGSYSGLATGMGLGRALRNVLIIDSGLPANRYTPHSHNFLTQDGKEPAAIAKIAKEQVAQYESVHFMDGQVTGAEYSAKRFHITLTTGARYSSSMLVFATGIIDLMPDIPGFAECWGKSVLHCPYCHGYEVRNTQTGILGNGDYAFEFGALISNWTKKLTIYTNGNSTLTKEQTSKLLSHDIHIVEHQIESITQDHGYVAQIVFTNGEAASVKTLYARPPFKQHCDLPKSLGCEITAEGYVKIDISQRTTVPGIYACGDNVPGTRTIANAISMGTTTAITMNKDMILQLF